MRRLFVSAAAAAIAGLFAVAGTFDAPAQAAEKGGGGPGGNAQAAGKSSGHAQNRAARSSNRHVTTHRAESGHSRSGHARSGHTAHRRSGRRSYGYRSGPSVGVVIGGTSCAYYHRRALATGSSYWWNRYYDCVN